MTAPSGAAAANRQVHQPWQNAEIRKIAAAAGPKLIALSGATGFLGAHIVVSLAAAGARIRILTHRQPPHPLWQHLPVEIISGSVTDPVSCARLAFGADAVIHAAGLIKATRDAAFSEVNAQGTAILAQAVRDSGPACRFVLISSLAVREPQLSSYAASKWAAELASQAAFSNAPGRLVILRPPVVYGPWDRETLVLFKAASGRMAPVFGQGRVAVLHVQDAANAITQVALGAASAGNYSLAPPGLAAYTVRELIEAAVQAVGGNPKIITVPDAVLRAAGTLSGWRARLRNRPEIFTASKARELLHPDWTVTAGEALPFSVFQPEINLHEGFRSTADWYKTAGWLARA